MRPAIRNGDGENQGERGKGGDEIEVWTSGEGTARIVFNRRSKTAIMRIGLKNLTLQVPLTGDDMRELAQDATWLGEKLP
jgi:hypothetical protein